MREEGAHGGGRAWSVSAVSPKVPEEERAHDSATTGTKPGRTAFPTAKPARNEESELREMVGEEVSMSQPPWRFNRVTWQMVERPGFEMECVTVPLGNLLTFNVYPPAVPPGTSVANHPVLRWNVTVPHLFLGFTVICYLLVPALVVGEKASWISFRERAPSRDRTCDPCHFLAAPCH